MSARACPATAHSLAAPGDSAVLQQPQRHPNGCLGPSRVASPVAGVRQDRCNGAAACAETYGLAAAPRARACAQRPRRVDGDSVPSGSAAFPCRSTTWSRSACFRVRPGRSCTAGRWAELVVAGGARTRTGSGPGDRCRLDPRRRRLRRTYCWSGRDGSELWRVEPVPYAQGAGFNGAGGWMMSSGGPRGAAGQ